MVILTKIAKFKTSTGTASSYKKGPGYTHQVKFYPLSFRKVNVKDALTKQIIPATEKE